MLAWPSPAVATSDMGAPGVVYGVDVTLLDAALDPMALMALRRMVYAVPLVSPVITIGDVVDAGEGTVYVAPPSVL
jgi:hypothetical protein